MNIQQIIKTKAFSNKIFLGANISEQEKSSFDLIINNEANLPKLYHTEQNGYTIELSLYENILIGFSIQSYLNSSSKRIEFNHFIKTINKKKLNWNFSDETSFRDLVIVIDGIVKCIFDFEKGGLLDRVVIFDMKLYNSLLQKKSSQ